MLKGSAIGLQKISRPKSKALKGNWVGSSVADVLYSTDCPLPVYLDIAMPSNAHRWLKFFLVCDPNWASNQTSATTDTWESTASESPTPASHQISIGSPEMVLGGPASTYDLGFTILPADIPQGSNTIRISLERLYEGSDEWDRPIYLDLRCIKLDTKGQAVSDPQNTKWLLPVHTDPQSKLLQVKYEGIIKSRVYSCNLCSGLIGTKLRKCRECTDFVICVTCHFGILQDRSRHPHEFVHSSG